MARQSWYLSPYKLCFCGVCACLACNRRAITDGDVIWSALLTLFSVVLATWAYYRWFVTQTEGFVSQKRELNEDYCLVDEAGNCKAFTESRLSQQSGDMYEKAISAIFSSNGPWKLHAKTQQDTRESSRLENSKTSVATVLRRNVSDRAGAGMERKGTGKSEAEVDTVYNGSFKTFAESISQLSNVMVSATCEEVVKVLVERCSDSRFVAMKLYQIELQSCLLARGGYLKRATTAERVELEPRTTGFAIIFNRAALQCNVSKLAEDFKLEKFLELLSVGRLHMAYFQSDAAVPTALSMARKAEDKAREAEDKANKAEDKAREAEDKANKAEDKARRGRGQGEQGRGQGEQGRGQGEQGTG